MQKQLFAVRCLILDFFVRAISILLQKLHRTRLRHNLREPLLLVRLGHQAHHDG